MSPFSITQSTSPSLTRSTKLGRIGYKISLFSPTVIGPQSAKWMILNSASLCVEYGVHDADS